MNGDCIVELRFRCTHPDRYCESLQHLVSAVANNVAADDLLIVAVDNQLHPRRHFGFAEGINHRRKPGFIDFDLVAVKLARLIFGQTHRANRRMRKNNRRNRVILESPVGHAVIKSISEPSSCGDSNRRQRGFAGHVAQRKNVIDIGLLPFISADESESIVLDAGRLQV